MHTKKLQKKKNTKLQSCFFAFKYGFGLKSEIISKFGRARGLETEQLFYNA